MEIIQICSLIGVFILMALLMFLRKLPALLALPIMSIMIAVLGGVSFADTIEYVVGAGSLKLHSAYTIAMFGSMLSIILQKTGVAENFIKKGAELSGDNPWIIAVIMLILITMLFTTLGGLGAIIMVATIVLPIMSSVGIGSMTIVGIFLIGLSIGGILNVGNWAVYISVMGLSVEEIRPFALIMFGISFIAALVYITIQLYRDGHDLNSKSIITKSIFVFVLLAGIIYIYNFVLSGEIKLHLITSLTFLGILIKWIIGAAIAALIITACYRMIFRKNETLKEPHWITFFSPIIPLFLILLYDLNFIAAFVVGLVYAFISTYKKGRLNMFIQSIFEGGAVVMPAVVLMFGIGMLLVAIMGPGGHLENYPNGWPVLGLLKPLMLKIVPTNSFTYVLLFTLAAPLALYRGPLNVWGMGYGLAAVFLASGLNPGAVMGLLLAVGQIQGISDPTNTHNVWLANEMRVDVQKVLWNTLPYTWILALLGLILSALLFM
ncbi:MAG: citrate transporter [Melioribacteraceae bacterium]|nr:citrate transporter [Melioribacteraceae bacterium]